MKNKNMDEQDQLSQATQQLKNDENDITETAEDATVGAGFRDEPGDEPVEVRDEETGGGEANQDADDGEVETVEEVEADQSASESENGGATVSDGYVAEIDDAVRREQVAEDGTQEVVLSANKLKVLVNALKCCEQNIGNVVRMLEKSSGTSGDDGDERLPAMSMQENREMELVGVKSVDGRVVEGVFDGQNMVGSDGKIYSVPPNYASKSKLVEGDMLKLTITSSGSFIYKQIGPIERVRVVSVLGFDPTVGEYYATSETKRWNVLKASVTYFKGEPDDEIVVLVPKNGPSKWAAVENIIKKVPNL